MKICFIAHGGPHTKNWMNYLITQKDFQVFYIGDKTGKNKFARSFIVPFNGIFHYILLIIVSQIIVRKYKPDVIISQYLTFHGFIASTIRKYPKISIGIGSDINLGTQNKIFSKLNRYTIQHSKKLVVVTELLKEKLMKSGVPGEKITVIPNGFNEVILKSPLLHNLQDLKTIDSNNNFKIIYTRGFNLVYDPLTLLKAIPLVLKDYPEVKFYLAGEGSLKNIVENFIIKKDLKENVFMLGWVEEQELSKLHQEAHIFVTSSLTDGLSVSLLKGILFNNVIVASEIKANTSLVSTLQLDRKTFLLFPCGDYKELAKKIVYTIQNYDQMRPSLQTNHNIVQDQFSNKKNFSKLGKIVRNLSN